MKTKINTEKTPATSADENPEIESKPRFDTDVAPQPDGDRPKVKDDNPFSPENIRLDQSELDSPAVKTERTSLPVRKPQKYEFIRVCADPEYRFGPVPFIELDREFYLVKRALKSSLLPREYWIGEIFLCTNPLNKPFLWVVKLQSPLGKVCDWYLSALECAERAMKEWLQVVSDQEAGAYEVSLAIDNLGEPEFPSHPPDEIIQLGFKRRYVDTMEHPVIGRLRGKKQ
jgi:hypothetical protein